MCWQYWITWIFSNKLIEDWNNTEKLKDFWCQQTSVTSFPERQEGKKKKISSLTTTLPSLAQTMSLKMMFWKISFTQIYQLQYTGTKELHLQTIICNQTFLTNVNSIFFPNISYKTGVLSSKKSRNFINLFFLIKI